MEVQQAIFQDLGQIHYQEAWDFQESLLKKNLDLKTDARKNNILPQNVATTNYFLICEHPPVYTLGKSGDPTHVLLSNKQREELGIEYFQTNRGGDITFHGLQQIVGYPILDLEKFYTDIGIYLRNLEEVIIKTIAEYGIFGERSLGETGVWIDAKIPGRERKIAAIGVRCSRWITMHGFALNVNTDLSYFNHIIPCGIVGKQVTSIEREIGQKVNYEEAKQKICRHFEEVYQVELLGSAVI